jgi:hypothetical protein
MVFFLFFGRMEPIIHRCNVAAASSARRTRPPFAIANAAITGSIKRGDLFAKTWHKSPFRVLATGFPTKHVWSKEWDKISLGATPPWEHKETNMNTVLFVETGFGCVLGYDIFPANSVLSADEGTLMQTVSSML